MRRAIRLLVIVAPVALVLAGCATLDPLGSTPRDVDGRPIAPGPATPTSCITITMGTSEPTCAPLHNPPSRTYVEQAIPTLLPTRGYGGVTQVRCSDRVPPTPPRSGVPDPDGLAAATEFSHWTCVGREPEGTYLHEDVLWTPYSGYLSLNAVSRDRSAGLTMPDPDDPGLPNPQASEATNAPSG